MSDFKYFLLDNLPSTEQGTAERPGYIHIGSFINKSNNRDVIPAIVPITPSKFNFNCLYLSGDTFYCQRQLQYIALDLLYRMKPELAKFTFVDYSTNSAFSSIWGIKSEQIKFITTSEQFKQEVEELFNHSRYINTQCLRGEYVDLASYNQDAEYKEAYHFIFIPQPLNSIFPQHYNNSEVLRQLDDIINNGNQHGIYFFIIDSPDPNTLDLHNLIIDYTNSYISMRNSAAYQHREHFDRLQRYCQTHIFYYTYCTDETTIKILTDKINHTTEQQEDKYFLNIPIGMSGRDRISLCMGGLVNHGFIAGATGTGKSNLLNNIITTIAQNYSPDELRLWLLDYKEGVEFEKYKNHPNVEGLLLDERNINAGVGTLRKLDEEIPKRRQLFNELGQNVQDIDRYNSISETKMPRILVIIDEVQKLFEGDWSIRHEIQRLVENIARQGRAFGIHMLFCSQSFLNIDIDRSTLAQMPLRIAFRLADEMECHAIMGQDNNAPTKLAKYHLVYNDSNGQPDSNIIVKSDYFNVLDINQIFQEAKQKFSDAQPFEHIDLNNAFQEDNETIKETIENKEEENKEEDFNPIF